MMDLTQETNLVRALGELDGSGPLHDGDLITAGGCYCLPAHREREDRLILVGFLIAFIFIF